MEEAIRHYEKSLDIDPSQDDLREIVRLYQQQKPLGDQSPQ
jgi:hypothetical protein